jgi:Predicted hydrolases or acyltransferases (alpha/beta hydrolase superfamily)
MPVHRVNGTSLYYEISGRGTPLLFIHGHGLTHEMFQPQIDYFKASYQVIAVDLRGNGQSGKLQAPSAKVIDIQCEDLSLLLGFLGVRGAVLIGADYGGILAQRFAYLYPNQVRALILADSLSKNTATSPSEKVWRSLWLVSQLANYLPGELFLRSLKVMYNRWDLAYRILRKSLLHKRTSEMLVQSLATNQVDYTSLLPLIRVPACCIAGDQAETDVRNMQDTAHRLPYGEFATIPDAFHLCNLCQPELFNKLVQAFLEDRTAER